MPQFFIPPGNISGKTFRLEGGESRHLTRVLRIRAGEEIFLFDGTGARYRARVDSFEGDSAAGTVLEALKAPEKTVRLMLDFALVSQNAVEDILTHCTETGVDCFRPIITARTQAGPAAGWGKKTDRLKQIVLSACKQSCRNTIPELLEPVDFAAALVASGPALLADSGEKSFDIREALEKLTAAGPGLKSVDIFIGPEGGFAPEELEAAIKAGAIPVSLGKNILRSETACVVASALVFNLLSESS